MELKQVKRPDLDPQKTNYIHVNNFNQWFDLNIEPLNKLIENYKDIQRKEVGPATVKQVLKLQSKLDLAAQALNKIRDNAYIVEQICDYIRDEMQKKNFNYPDINQFTDFLNEPVEIRIKYMCLEKRK